MASKTSGPNSLYTRRLGNKSEHRRTGADINACVLRRFYERFLENLEPAVWTQGRIFKNVVGNTGIRTGDSIKDIVEGNYGAFRIAVFAGFDQSFRSTQSCGFN